MAEGEDARRSVDELPKVWVLLGNRVGDNNQLLALAEGLGLPFETKQLHFSPLRRIPWLRGGARLRVLSPRGRALIRPPWPDLVIGCGYGSVPVARYIRQQAGGTTKIVQFGNPRSHIDDLDLLITTPQYARAPAPNVVALPFPVGDPAAASPATAEERSWLDAHPGPRRLLAVGGPTRNWKVDTGELRRAIASLLRRCEADGGTLIAATSHRTDWRSRRVLHRLLKGSRHPIVERFPRFGTLLATSDEFTVTADSVSMMAETMLTGRPVGVIPVRPSAGGR